MAGNPNWVKGVSGNPGGTPKGWAKVKEAARAHTEAAITALVNNLSDENGSVRNTAAQALLDRGWGKPAQPQTGEDGEGPVQVEHITRTIVDPREAK